MPRKRPPKPSRVREKDHSLEFQSFGIDPEKHGDFKKGMLEAAQAAVNEFPELLRAIKDGFAHSYPPQALSAFCCYGSAGFISTTGKITEALPEILQHHCELLHALLLTVPPDEWGGNPIMLDSMEELFDTVPRLSDTFFMQRILDGEAISNDEEQMTARSLQERVRMHTHVVRNWGYFEQVVQTSRDLYAPFDKNFVDAHGFSVTDLIDVLVWLHSEAERRMSDHLGLSRKILRGQTAIKLVERYYKLVPNLVGNVDEMLSGLPADVTREQMSGMIMAHLDLRLVDTRLFAPDDVAASTGKPIEVVSAILSALSFEPGALSETKPEFLFLDNPVWERPVISLGYGFLVPLPQAAFSHIHKIIECLAREAGLDEPLQDRRAGFLERSLEDLFRTALH